jgi:hypothetical protein
MYKYKVSSKILDNDEIVEDFLNTMSEKGWEFVSHSYNSDEGLMVYIFKKELKDTYLGPPK